MAKIKDIPHGFIFSLQQCFDIRGGKTYIHHMKSTCSTANFAMNSRETRGLFALLDLPGNVDEGGGPYSDSDQMVMKKSTTNEK